MYLTPTEEDRLRVFTAAELARRTLALGLRLNAPEAIALACDEMHLAARRGNSFEEVIEAGRAAVSPDRLMDGVADMVNEIRLEVLLNDGSRLVVLRRPWVGQPGGLGSVRTQGGSVELAPELERRRLTVRNESARSIRVSSHNPFSRTNAGLAFDRDAARGFRLNVIASTDRFHSGYRN
jgi:urease subunit gamma/beta